MMLSLKRHRFQGLKYLKLCLMPKFSYFQAWMRELNVSQSFEDRTAKIQAYDLQMQYNTKMYSKLNFNK